MTIQPIIDEWSGAKSSSTRQRISCFRGIRAFVIVVLSVMTLTWACATKSENARPPVPKDAAAGGPQASLPSDPATAEHLEPVFPEIPGWTRGPVISGNSANEPTPGISTTPVSYTGVQTTYSAPQIYVDASLLDSVDMAGLFVLVLETGTAHNDLAALTALAQKLDLGRLDRLN